MVWWGGSRLKPEGPRVRRCGERALPTHLRSPGSSRRRPVPQDEAAAAAPPHQRGSRPPSIHPSPPLPSLPPRSQGEPRVPGVAAPPAPGFLRERRREAARRSAQPPASSPAPSQARLCRCRRTADPQRAPPSFPPTLPSSLFMAGPGLPPPPPPLPCGGQRRSGSRATAYPQPARPRRRRRARTARPPPASPPVRAPPPRPTHPPARAPPTHPPPSRSPPPAPPRLTAVAPGLWGWGDSALGKPPAGVRGEARAVAPPRWPAWVALRERGPLPRVFLSPRGVHLLPPREGASRAPCVALLRHQSKRLVLSPLQIIYMLRNMLEASFLMAL